MEANRTSLQRYTHCLAPLCIQNEHPIPQTCQSHQTGTSSGTCFIPQLDSIVASSPLWRADHAPASPRKFVLHASVHRATNLPKAAPPLVSAVRHDMYDAISPAHALAHAAKGLAVLITGSGRGVGRAEALAFAQAAAKKVVLTSRSRDELDEVKKEIQEATRDGRSASEEGECEVIVHVADLCDPASVDALFEAAGELDGEQFPTGDRWLVATRSETIHDRRGGCASCPNPR